MNVEISTGVTGAKRQSYASSNPRDVLLKVAKQLDDEGEIREKCWLVVANDQNMLRTIYDYWFQNNYRSLALKEPRRKRTRKEIKAAVEKLQSQITTRVEREVKIRLLDMIMPSGKPLSNSSREELLISSSWTMRIAERLRPGQTVADAGLTEEELQRLYTLEEVRDDKVELA